MCSDSIAAVSDVIGAFGGGVKAERGGDELADLIEAARPCRAHEGLEFGESELNRIEVRTVRWQKPKPRAGVRNQRVDGGLFVDGEIVEHHHVAAPQCGHQDLLDVGEETRVIDRAIEHGGRGQALETQAGDYRVRLPMSARRVIANPDAAQTAAVATEQVRGHPTFVEKHILPDIAEWKPRAPAPAVGDDIRPALFVGVDGFF